MDIKKLIESMDRIEECGMNEMPPMAAPMDQGSPVSMNVSLNASGKEHVEDLINMMKNAGMQAPEPAGDKMLAPRMDIERLRGIVDGPEMEADEAYADAAEEEVEEWDNEPDPEYGDISDAIPDGDDLNRKKKAFAKAQDGDNAMAVEAIKSQLMAALQEKKAKPDFLDVDKDGDKKEPMKKALKDKGSKPKKGEVPPQFKKK
jgi:hypothetical protein